MVAADVPYQPMTAEERWRLFHRENFTSISAYLPALGSAIGAQLANDPSQWGKTGSGYFKRAGTIYAGFTIANGVESGLDAVTGLEPRYVRCRCKGAVPRTRHAILYALATMDGNGHTVPHFSRIAGAYAGAFTVETWMPGGYDRWRAIRLGTGQIYFGGAFNILQEFTPELKRIFKRK